MEPYRRAGVGGLLCSLPLLCVLLDIQLDGKSRPTANSSALYVGIDARKGGSYMTSGVTSVNGQNKIKNSIKSRGWWLATCNFRMRMIGLLYTYGKKIDSL